MGANLTMLNRKQNQNNCLAGLKLNLTRLQEYYCNFRTICSTFTVDVDQLRDIFPKTPFLDSLKIFSNDDGLIDGLELFAVLIIFCEDAFEEKVKFLFDVFDFNDLNTLCLTDFDFMLNCVVGGVFTVFSVSKPMVAQDLSKLLTKRFDRFSQINISHILAFAIECEEVSQFFAVIRQVPPVRDTLSANETILKLENKENDIPQYLLQKKFRFNKFISVADQHFVNSGQIVFSQLTKSKNELMSSVIKKVRMDQVQCFSVNNAILKLNWVYGFPTMGQLKSFLFHEDFPRKKNQRGDRKIIYAVENVVVVLYYKINKQSHFKEHGNLVNSLCVSPYGKLCASGDEGPTPRIYIWKIKDLKTVTVLQTVPNSHIYLMSFAKNDRFLVCLSKRHNPPICVFDLLDNSVVITTFVSEFLLGISPMICLKGRIVSEALTKMEFTHTRTLKTGSTQKVKWDMQTSFTTCSSSKAYMFMYDTEKRIYDVLSIDYAAHFPEEKIKASLSIFQNKENLELNVYGGLSDYEMIILVGSQKGSLILTENFKVQNELTHSVILKVEKSIEQLLFFKEKYLVLGVEGVGVKIFDYVQREIVFEFNLNDLGIRLKDQMIKNIEKGSPNSLFICTWEGDLLKVSLPEKDFLRKTGLQGSIRCRRIHSVSPLPENLSAMCLVEREEGVAGTDTDAFVYAASKNSKISGFSQQSRKLADAWSVESEITALDTFTSYDKNIVFAVGLLNGRIYIRYDWELYYKSFNCGDKITCLKFSQNGMHLVAGCGQCILYIFNFTHGTIFEFNPREVSFGEEVPLSINFSQDQKCFIVGTSQSRYYEVTVEGKKSELISDNSKIQLPYLNLKYFFPGYQKTITCVMEPIYGLIFMGEREGVISVFNSVKALEENSATYYYGHNGRIVDLIVSRDKKKLFSISAKKGSIFEWRIEMDLKRSESKNSLMSNFSVSNIANCPSITRPIIVCSNIFPKLLNKEESFVYFRGFSNPFLRKIFGEKQPFGDEISYLPKRYPNCSLELTHVYGFEAFDLRNCIFYLSDSLTLFESQRNEKNGFIEKYCSAKKIGSSSSPQMLLKWELSAEATRLRRFQKKSQAEFSETSENHLDEQFNNFSAPDFPADQESEMNQFPLDRQTFLNQRYAHKKMSILPTVVATEESLRDIFGKNSLPEVPSERNEKREQRPNSNRFVVYVASRIAIFVDPKMPNAQKFYQAHDAKISAICVHKIFRLVATSEATINPKIHVWNPFTQQNLTRINTHHRLGVIIIQFSVKGTYVFTVSVDSLNSIQISNWETGEVEAFRNTGRRQIVALEVNPTSHKKFVTGSRGSVDLWKFAGHSIIHQRSIDLTPLISDNFVTTLTFLNYTFQSAKKSDLLFSSSAGLLGVISNDHCIKSKLVLPGKTINVVRLLQVSQRLLIFVATSESKLSVFDIKLNKVQNIEIGGNLSAGVDQSGNNSFDLTVHGDLIFGVVGINLGRIAELELTPVDSLSSTDPVFKHRARDLVVSHANQNYSGPDFEYNYLFKKKVLLTVHPTHFVFVSVGSDKVLKIFDFENHAQLHEINLVSYLNKKEDAPLNPTCIKFSTKGENLVIGFDDASILVVRIVVTRNVNISHTSHTASVFKNGKILRDEKINTAVLNIEFSPKGNFMAVSFDNKKTHLDQDNETTEKSGAVIVIYEVKAHENLLQSAILNTPETDYQKRRELRLASLNAPEISKMSILGNANYFMSFSEDEFYLIVYYQNINNNLVRENKDREGRYMVWNHETAATEMNWEILKNVEFKNNNFPNHYFGLRVYHDGLAFSNDTLQMTNYLGKVDQLEKQKIVLSAVNGRNSAVLFLGSEDGEIFLAKNSATLMAVDQNPENLGLQEMCQCKKFAAHTSFVNQIEFNSKENVLLTSAISDECVFQWRITQVDPEYELDHRDVDMNASDDIYEEIVPFENFDTVLRDVYHRRNTYSDILTNLDLRVYPKYQLTLSKVIGRNAKKRRSNMCFTFNNQLIYSAGTQLVLLDMADKQVMRTPSQHKKLTLNMPKTNNGQFQITISKEKNQESYSQQSLDNRDESSSKLLDGSQKAEPVPSMSILQNEKKAANRADSFSKAAEEQPEANEEGFPQEENQKSGSKTGIQQQFLTAEPENLIQAPGEISCLELSEDQLTMCVGTNESVSALNFWDASSKSYLGKISIINCVSVLLVRFAQDNKYLACLGLTRDYTVAVYIVGIDQMQVLAFLTFNYSIPFKIKDLSFIIGKNNEFVSVGINHASRWTFGGGVLSFRELKYEEPYESIKAYRQESSKNEKPAIHTPGFLAIKFLAPNIFVSSCMKGFIYGWLNDELLSKRLCYNNSPAVVIAKSPSNKLDFLVGGYGVPLVYYKLFLSTQSMIRMVSVFKVDIFDATLASPSLPEFQVQTLLWVDPCYLIYGTRSGDIAEAILDLKKIQGHAGLEMQPCLNDDLSSLSRDSAIIIKKEEILNFFDQEIPRSVDFSKDGQSILLLTENGVFVAFNFHSLKTTKTIQFSKKANTMLVLSDMIILVFERHIIALESNQTFSRLHQYDKDTIAPINKARTNPFQDMIALAYYAHSDLPSMIEVYKIEDSLVKFFSIPTDEIRLLDFSVNNVYLMYQELNGKSFILNVTLSKLEVQGLDNDDPIEWIGDGFHLNEKRKFINQSYSEETEIVNIVKIGTGALAVTDELGTVSL